MRITDRNRIDLYIFGYTILLETQTPNSYVFAERQRQQLRDLAEKIQRQAVLTRTETTFLEDLREDHCKPWLQELLYAVEMVRMLS